MPDKKSNVIKFRPRPKPEPEPFAPMTGNPENGDYLDWYRRWQEDQIRFKKPDNA